MSYLKAEFVSLICLTLRNFSGMVRNTPRVLLPVHSRQPHNLKYNRLSQTLINTNKIARDLAGLHVLSEHFPLSNASSTTTQLLQFYLQSKLQHLERIIIIFSMLVLRGLMRVEKIRISPGCLSHLDS